MMEDKHRKRIAVIAFNLFRDWTKNAKEFYPDMDFTIIDETKLVEDLERTILLGISELQKEEKLEKRKQPEFDYGFLTGFVQGTLEISWMYEYINKNTESYRNFMACKSILEYLRFDIDTGNRINKLYKGLIKEDTNLSVIDINIDEKHIEKYGLNKASKEKQYFEKDTPVYTYLENQLSIHIVDLMENENRKMELMPGLESYFEPEFVKEIILFYDN